MELDQHPVAGFHGKAQSAAEFRKYVEETRKRRDAEREERRRREVKPDSISG